MTDIAQLILGLSNRIKALEDVLSASQTRVLDINTSNRISGSAQRIPISGEEYYIDFDGSAKLKAIQIAAEAITFFSADEDGIVVAPEIIQNDTDTLGYLCVKEDGTVCKRSGTGGDEGVENPIILTVDSCKAKIELNNVNNKPVFVVSLSDDGGSTWAIRQKLSL